MTVPSWRELRSTVDSIVAVQQRDGAIPWFPGGELDPWDHIEAAMALDVGGLHANARHAYRWLLAEQRRGGWWPAKYREGAPVCDFGETHHSAYLAVGLWHHFLATDDEAFLVELWPTVRAATDFVVRHQETSGVVPWAVHPETGPDPVALLTGSASTYHGLRCASAIAEHLGHAQPDWELAAADLQRAIAERPDLFADKGRYSMDWYYPVLGGAVRGKNAADRLADRWDEFVVPGFGARCVADRPWVTGAETCELALALHANGDPDAAAHLIADMQHLRDDDGSYWTGLVFDEGVRWPVERTTWTAAAVVLAVDAVNGEHVRSTIFSDPQAQRPSQVPYVA
ncbi:prenyltransferase [Virgisporangium aurantiacum]|uniref:Prenyltransferase n=1 Tax=Virgisporangium aurantiacum TaxID=175570 RepID=A0A8J4E3Y0_9ACTN|nr:prenyltransferase [Virgisporangium aurantiacum]GIJ60504.1 prenyltransferase [Virgisporangium aurantiacum]